MACVCVWACKREKVMEQCDQLLTVGNVGEEDVTVLPTFLQA